MKRTILLTLAFLLLIVSLAVYYSEAYSDKGVTVCLKDGYTFEDGSQCKTFRQALGAGPASQLVPLETWDGKKITVPIDRIKGPIREN